MDLFFIEELVADPELLVFLFERFGFNEPDWAETSIRHSATQEDGESDVEVWTTISDGRKIALLVENKVKASFQPRQAERYRQRAEVYLRSGVDAVKTLLFAPSRYIGNASDNHGFDECFTYEELLMWMQRSYGETPRIRYKELLVQAAIEKSQKGYSRRVDGAASDFWLGYWRIASELEPELRMKKPKGNPASSTFIQFCPENLPPRMTIVHKLLRGVVDVHFPRWAKRVEELAELTVAIRDPDMTVHQTKPSAALRLEVPELRLLLPPEGQAAEIIAGVRAAGRLLRWLREHDPEIRGILARPVEH